MIKLNIIDMDNNDNFKKKPKVTPRVRAKKESKTSSELSDGSSLDIKTILKAALQAHSENHQRRTVSDTDALVATIEEFLSAFLIIGYNFNGDYISIANTKSQKDTDSLVTAVSRFFFTHCVQGPTE